MSETNRYLDGKKHGYRVFECEKWRVAEGPCAEAKNHGDWIPRHAGP